MIKVPCVRCENELFLSGGETDKYIAERVQYILLVCIGLQAHIRHESTAM
jgi:hypothetical protein